MLRPNVSYCIDNNEVHYNPYDPYHGHDYVDLGLPSGTLWATCNVGASSPTDSGLYFAWGETTGYTAAQVGTDKNFTWADYGLGNGGSDAAAMTKYNSTDGLTSLQAVDDAASVNMGGAWHMPTSTQISELLNTAYVTNQSVTNYQGSGVSGTLYTSVVDNSQTLFFPISRYCADGEFNYRNESALIWSQSLKNNDVIWGRTLTNENLERFLGQNHRYAGLVVRGVIG